MNPQNTAVSGAQTTQLLKTQTYYSRADTFNVSSTLISASDDAILIDAQFTLAEGRKVADWIGASGKRLAAIFITHAHPDHHFGLPEVLARFPGTPVYAIPEVVEEARRSNAAKVEEWRSTLGPIVTDRPILPNAFREPLYNLEGHRIDIIRLGAADSASAAAFWIPETHTLVAGDSAFEGCHAWLADADAAQRKEWTNTIATLQRLAPTRVIPGHRGKPGGESPACLKDTAAYIEAFENSLLNGATAAQVVKTMTGRFPKLELPKILEAAATKWALARDAEK